LLFNNFLQFVNNKTTKQKDFIDIAESTIKKILLTCIPIIIISLSGSNACGNNSFKSISYFDRFN